FLALETKVLGYFIASFLRFYVFLSLLPIFLFIFSFLFHHFPRLLFSSWLKFSMVLFMLFCFRIYPFIYTCFNCTCFVGNCSSSCFCSFVITSCMASLLFATSCSCLFKIDSMFEMI